MKEITVPLFLFFNFIGITLIAQPVPINVGESIIDELAFEGDINTYEFCSAANVPLFIRAASENINFLGVEVYNEFEDLLESITTISVGEIRIITPISGKFKILIKKGSTVGNGQGAYSLSLQRTTQPVGAIPLTCNMGIMSALDFVTEAKVFTFSATAGTQMNLNASSETISFLRLELYNGNGELIDEDNSIFSAKIQREFTESGLYSLMVMSHNGKRIGDFSLAGIVIAGTCDAVNVASEICDNNIDDDGDGLIDCQDEDCCNFVELPVAQIAGVTEFCEGENSMLTANGGSTFAWSSGENTPSIMVVDAANYTVTVTDENGCSARERVTVIVNELPKVKIDGTLKFCDGEDSKLLASGGDSYTWNTGSSDNTITVSTQGDYTVTVTNDKGCSDSITAEVIVHPLPDIIIDGDKEFCEGEFTTLTASGGTAYRWNSGEEVPAINVDFQFNFRVTVTNEEGCKDSKEARVIENDLPRATIDGDLSICEGESTTLLANGGVSYAWNTTQNIPVINVNTPGDYMVTVTDNNGCKDTETVSLFVNPLPLALIEGKLIFCQGENTTLEASGGTLYDWNTGANTPTIEVTTANDYKVTVTDENGCVDIESVTTLINELPEVSLILEKNAFCVDKSNIPLTGGMPIGGEYIGNGIAENSLNAAQVGIGNYLMTYTFVADNGCGNSDSVEIIIDEESCVTSLTSEISNTTLTLFPNPTANDITLEFEGVLDRDLNIIIFDNMGKRIQTNRIAKENLVTHFNTQIFNNGTYIFQISDGIYTIYRKVIIARK